MEFDYCFLILKDGLSINCSTDPVLRFIFQMLSSCCNSFLHILLGFCLLTLHTESFRDVGEETYKSFQMSKISAYHMHYG